jgi:hypothetical protein
VIRRSAPAAAIVLLLGMTTLGCSDDDGSAVRETGGSVRLVGPAPEGGGGSVSAVGTGCVTKGATTKIAAASVEIDLDEWSITPPETPIGAGVVRIVAKNYGSEAHALTIVAASSVAELTADDGSIDPAALEAAETHSIESFAGNTICEGTFELAPGPYVLLCDLVQEDAGQTLDHFELGMATAITIA